MAAGSLARLTRTRADRLPLTRMVRRKMRSSRVTARNGSTALRSAALGPLVWSFGIRSLDAMQAHSLLRCYHHDSAAPHAVGRRHKE